MELACMLRGHDYGYELPRGDHGEVDLACMRCARVVRVYHGSWPVASTRVWVNGHEQGSGGGAGGSVNETVQAS
jgi:hypothetical protein